LLFHAGKNKDLSRNIWILLLLKIVLMKGG